jgi:hypothetical protein
LNGHWSQKLLSLQLLQMMSVLIVFVMCSKIATMAVVIGTSRAQAMRRKPPLHLWLSSGVYAILSSPFRTEGTVF